MRYKIAISLAGAAACMAAGCSTTVAGGSVGRARGASTSSTKITLAVTADPGSLNPITNVTGAGEQVVGFAYESLLAFPQGKQPIGDLAQRWTATPTKAVFTLKKGITCSDGTPLTASDVAATFTYAEKPATGSGFAGVYFPTSGLKVVADNAARTVTFDVSTPESFLAQTVGNLPIVCPAGLANPTAMSKTTYGTGPYQLVSSSPGVSYTFKLRSDYRWGPGGVTSKTPGLPSTVVVSVVTTPSTAASLLLTNGIQVAAVSGSAQERLKATSVSEKIATDLNPGELYFNQASSRPGHSLAVREAIAAAINRNAVGEVSSDGLGKPLDTLVEDYGSVCPGDTNASARSIPHYDLAKAKQLLDQAGWKVGSGGMRNKDGTELTLRLLYSSEGGPALTSAIELVQQELAKVGIKGVLAPSSSFTTVLFQGGNWDLAWVPISTNLPATWQGVLSGTFPPKGGNWTYNTNQQFFKLADEAQHRAGKASCRYWTAAQSSVFRNLEVLPIFTDPTTTFGIGVKFGLANSLVLPTTLRVMK